MTGLRRRSACTDGLVRPILMLAFAGAIACGSPGDGTGDGAEAGERTTSTARLDTAPAAPGRGHVLDLDPDRPGTSGLDSAAVAAALARADSLPRLRCLLVARYGETLVEWCRDGFEPGEPANVKSVSKSVLSALVGIAIAEGHLDGVDQPALPLLGMELDGDSLKRRITIGNLLSMQAGLERTSGRNYGGWVASANWVREAVRRPMVAQPGGRMLYSTGNYHLLSAILTRVTGQSTLSYARSRLGDPLGIAVPAWLRDPQGIYFGGNEMRLSPRAMVRFGELYRSGGVYRGRQVVPGEWVRSSLQPRTRSPWSGEEYGYGWFLGEAGDYPMFYAWGYGGQFIFVVPDLALTVATTSDPAVPRGGGHLREVHALLDEALVPAAERGVSGGVERPDQPDGGP